MFKKGKVGFIGLGIMGKPMAKNLIRAGYELIVYDIAKDPVSELVALGATSAGTCKEVAERCNGLLFTMLPNSPHVKK
jgi:2-hydroxy-3-oxopropionate reductase